MKLIIDAMGGDNAPLEIVKGALSGQKRWGVDVTLTGDTTAILQALEACGEKTLPQGMEIVHTTAPAGAVPPGAFPRAGGDEN